MAGVILDRVTRRFDADHPAVDDVSLELRNGELLAVLGRSGSGKTTLLRLIAGFERPDAGEVRIAGESVAGNGRFVPPERRRIGMVFQSYALWPHMDVRRNVGYPLEARGVRGAEYGTRVDKALAAVGLADFASRHPQALSGGQRQRVALARALVPRPAALLLDEPFSALDAELRRAVRAEVRAALRAANVPVILVTHDREEALALGDEVQVMERGRAIARGDPVRVLGHPSQARLARLVGVENLLTMRVRAVDRLAGVTVCEAGGVTLEIPLVEAVPGDEVTIGIRAEDIILASEEPRGLSARNRLPGAVRAVEARGTGYEVTLDCGLPLRCHVTEGALRDLHIIPEARLWAVIKASSCFVVG